MAVPPPAPVPTTIASYTLVGNEQVPFERLSVKVSVNWFAKMRVFRVPEFLGAALMLGLLATLLLFVSRSL